MKLMKDLLPISAILLVVISMTIVDIVIINEPLRALTSIPILIIIGLWFLATLKLRRSEVVR